MTKVVSMARTSEYWVSRAHKHRLAGRYDEAMALLGKTQDAAEEIFYIGVPGVYLEREKRVAVMFGFEGFAQSVTKSGGTPERGGRRMVEPGAFGYYMKKVEI